MAYELTYVKGPLSIYFYFVCGKVYKWFHLKPMPTKHLQKNFYIIK